MDADAIKQLKRVARQTCRAWASRADAIGAAHRLLHASEVCGAPFAVEVVPARGGRFKVQPFGVHLRQHCAPIHVAVLAGRCLLCQHGDAR